MGENEIEKFIEQVEAVQHEKKHGQVVRWYFSKHGFTQKAMTLLAEGGIYASELSEFNMLADLFGLQPLIV